MKCPYCAHAETKVLESRDNDEADVLKRRRECLKCEKRFTTFERIEEIELSVIKKDGSKEKFDRNKMLMGLLKACQKRPVDKERIEKAVDDIERTLRRQNSIEISSQHIGELVMKKLRNLDAVAYIRFASVYKDFADLKTFEQEIKLLKEEKRG
ncbi:MAG: transcriptional regulator NrdR [archaeon]